MLRFLARPLLWLLNLLVPVFIAACYGAPADFSGATLTGKVLDGTTQGGIYGIQVTCLRAGQPFTTDYTDLDGSFALWDSCDQVRFEDLDGAENGGLYVQRTVTLDPGCTEITVELHD
ncbi:MAG TPA: hypothetical protein PK668_03300 [Myxococcota bacterium]|nr:hypothetical protein [Myxococcota bacterium]HRY91881.1 hypothetical protein [Myxococcota bacterium]HSA22224.1 hypothetical protein [Myxococcota bacterium]